VQTIAGRWADIETLFAEDADAVPVEAVDAFLLSLRGFQESGLFLRTYLGIPFLHRAERGFAPHPFTDVGEVGLALGSAAVFRDSVVSGEPEKARAAAAEVSGSLMRLLIISADKQRNTTTLYFRLFVTLVAIIVIVGLPSAWFLNRSLTRSLAREADGTAFSHTYMLAQDVERARISRELHDAVIQDMLCLMLETEKIGDTDDESEREGQIGKAVSMTAGLVRKARDICNDLIPPDFRHSELPDALRLLCLDFGAKTGIDCRAEIDGDVRLEFLALEKRLQVYRIVQESLANIAKHSGAKEAIVTTRSGRDGIIYIGISDDGKGFVSPLDDSGKIVSGADKSHLGIVSMRERAAILGASLKIESEPGGGALIRLEIPAKGASNGSVVD